MRVVVGKRKRGRKQRIGCLIQVQFSGKKHGVEVTGIEVLGKMRSMKGRTEGLGRGLRELGGSFPEGSAGVEAQIEM